MGMIYEKLEPCPICGDAVLGLTNEYEESFAYIQCNHCDFEFAAQRKPFFYKGDNVAKLAKYRSNKADTIRLWNTLPRDKGKGT